MQQGIQQLAVVELAFQRQIKALRKPICKCRFERGDLCAVYRLGLGQCRHLALGRLKLAGEAGGLWGVLAMPKNQGALLLEKHRLLKFAQHFRPAAQSVLPHLHHWRFGHGGFRQRREHGCGHPRGGTLGVRACGIKQRHRMPLARQLAGQQAAHQARAQDDR